MSRTGRVVASCSRFTWWVNTLVDLGAALNPQGSSETWTFSTSDTWHRWEVRVAVLTSQERKQSLQIWGCSS